MIGVFFRSTNSLPKAFALLGVISLFFGCRGNRQEISISPYPAGYDFAFTITDDPDEGWLAQKKAVYDFLDSLGMRTSVGVWVFDNKSGSGTEPYYHQGVSLEDPEFLRYVRHLRSEGFSTFLHTASGGNDLRDETIAAFEKYKDYFGEYPDHWVNHSTNYENIYWGHERFRNPVLRMLYKWHTPIDFQGEDTASQYFWGDYCKKYVKYVRGWMVPDLNTLKDNPSMPFYDRYEPSVKLWYSSSDGATRTKFDRLISREHVDKLIKEHGTAIVYTHFARGFVDRRTGALNPRTRELLSYVASHKNGWFVSVDTLLDRLLALKSTGIFDEKSRYIIVNTGDKPIGGVVLEIFDTKGVTYGDSTYQGAGDVPALLVIDTLPPRSAIELRKLSAQMDDEMSMWERMRLEARWAFAVLR